MNDLYIHLATPVPGLAALHALLLILGETGSMVKSSQKMHLCLNQMSDIMIEPTGNIL